MASRRVGRLVLKKKNKEDFEADGNFKGGPTKTAIILFESDKPGFGPQPWVPPDSPLHDVLKDFYVNMYLEDDVKLVVSADDAGDEPAF